MATIVNARDILLQGAADRLIDYDLPSNINVPVDNIPALTGVSLTASSQIFQIPETGDPYPSSIILRAIVRNLTANPVLSIIDGSMSISPVFDMNNKFEFTADDMTSDSVVFQVTVSEPDPEGGPDIEYIDTFTILKTREGSGATIGFLTNENFTLTADEDGNVLSYVGASGHFVVIQGLTDITTSCTFSVFDNPQGLSVVLDTGGAGAGAYSVVSGFDAADDVATVTFRATYGTLTLDKVLSLSKAIRGGDGAMGSPGDKTAKVELYAWSTSQPANPNGSSTYTWATGAHTSFTGPTWSTSVPTNPGSPGIKLWTAQQQLPATAGTTTSTTVTWNSSGTGYTVFAQGQNGSDGVSGLQTATATVYQWAPSTPAGPTGSDVYTWATRNFSGPSGIGSTWFFAPGTPPSTGYTLWAATRTFSDTAGNTTYSFNWTGAAINAVGYAGTNGSSGAQGASARTAYSRIAGNPSPTSGNISTSGGSTFPSSSQSNTTWGLNVSWTGNDPNPSSTNTLYQTDGFYDPVTGLTVWNTPYISSLKVGSLSAITVNTGSLNVSGQLAIGSGGYINSNSAGFESGAGFYLDSQNFSIGQSGAYLSYSTTSGLLKTGNIQMNGLLITPGKTQYDIGSGIMLGRYAVDGYSYFGVTNTTSGVTKGIWVTSSDGIVHMTGADVSGGTITGSTFQTSSGSTKVVIGLSGGNDLRFYESGTEKVYVGTSGSSYVFGSFGTQLDARGGLVGYSGSSSGVAGIANTGSGGSFTSTSGYGITAQSGGAYSAIIATHAGSAPAISAVSTSSGIAFYGVGAVQSSSSFDINDGGTIRGKTYYNSGAFKVESVGSTPLILASGGALGATFPTSGGMSVSQGFGCNGQGPQGKVAVGFPASAGDYDRALALVNSIRQALINNGILEP